MVILEVKAPEIYLAGPVASMAASPGRDQMHIAAFMGHDLFEVVTQPQPMRAVKEVSVPRNLVERLGRS